MANAPIFGKWEDDNVAPYTEYFEFARKKIGKRNLSNLNAQIGQTSVSNGLWHSKASSSNGEDNVQGREQSHLQPQIGTLSHEEVKVWQDGADSPQNGQDKFNPGGARRRGNLINTGYDEHSPVDSPLNPYISSRVANKVGPRSPSQERGPLSTRDFSPSTPRRSRLEVNTQSNDKKKKGLEIPKFGEWDVNDPAAGEYSLVFSRVRVEREKLSGNLSSTVSKSDISKYDGEDSNETSEISKRSCLCWFIK